MNKFDYRGNTFQPLRNLSSVEAAQENIQKRTNGYKDVVTIEEYSHSEFYEIAKENKSCVDLYLMNDCDVVLPAWNKFFKYNENAPLQHSSLTYFTECCGKIVEFERLKEQNIYRCPRCKLLVTKTGESKVPKQ